LSGELIATDDIPVIFIDFSEAVSWSGCFRAVKAIAIIGPLVYTAILNLNLKIEAKI
jgi:hypothetical protein